MIDGQSWTQQSRVKIKDCAVTNELTVFFFLQSQPSLNVPIAILKTGAWTVH